MSELVLESGLVLAGKYRIERVLGRGGMGVVAAARHLQLDQRVAIKLMLPHAMGNPEAISRFLREARAAARISSEHVARVFDLGSLPTGEPYIAMEYLQGADLGELLASRGRFSPELAVEYLLQASEALAEAHAAGIVHRDLKPGNLFLAERVDGQRLIKILDFGISKMSGGSATQSSGPMTHTSALMGSPLYMSPEQMTSSKAVDARSDIWALGVVLYEMLSGSPPFNADTLPQVCAMIMSEQPAPLASRVPGLSPVAVAAVERCLNKQPDARFQNVAELAIALEPLASTRARQSIDRISRVLGLTDPAAPASVRSLAVAQPGTNAPWSETKPPLEAPKRSFRPLIGGALLVGLVAAGWLVRRQAVSRQADQPPVSASTVAPLAPLMPSASALPPPTVATPEPKSSPEPTASPSPSATSRAPRPAPPRLAPSRPVVASQPVPSSKSDVAPALAPSSISQSPIAPMVPAPTSTRSRL